ncbi:hypothetical protein BZG36_04823 [Bifiguratus adelaidae]|uniref:Ion transport domain-containing protein n=1 Tax=Bifiguratus adelaidae TaxID=1938954 RepID=A0A261XVB2_9FUNG|nr:hypothetical protein BZG36_04823 [Bifiguratus adelaidae]
MRHPIDLGYGPFNLTVGEDIRHTYRYVQWYHQSTVKTTFTPLATLCKTSSIIEQLKATGSAFLKTFLIAKVKSLVRDPRKKCSKQDTETLKNDMECLEKEITSAHRDLDEVVKTLIAKGKQVGSSNHQKNPRFFHGTIKTKQEEVPLPYAPYLSHDFISFHTSISKDEVEYKGQRLNLVQLSFTPRARARLQETQMQELRMHVLFARPFPIPGHLLAAELGLFSWAIREDEVEFMKRYIQDISAPSSLDADEHEVGNIEALVPLIPQLIRVYPGLMTRLLYYTSLWRALDHTYPYALAYFYGHPAGDRELQMFRTNRPLVCYAVDAPSKRPFDTVANVPRAPFDDSRGSQASRFYDCDPFLYPLRNISRYPIQKDMLASFSAWKDSLLAVTKDLRRANRYTFLTAFKSVLTTFLTGFVISDKERSTFLKIIMLDDDLLLQARVLDSLNFEVLIAYKWNAYARNRYYFLVFLHFLLYALLWCLGSSHVVKVMQEARQNIAEGPRYYSIYNIIDFGTYILALATGVQWIWHGSINAALYSIAIFFTWLQLMSHLRSVRIGSSLFGFWLVLVLTTFAFAHSLWVQSLTNNIALSNYDKEAAMQPSNTETAADRTLLVTYQSVWYFIAGNYADFQDSDLLSVKIFAFVFLISVGIILMNVLIALINTTVAQSNVTEEFQLRLQKASVLQIDYCTNRNVLDETFRAKRSHKISRDIAYLASEEKILEEKAYWNSVYRDQELPRATNEFFLFEDQEEDWTEPMHMLKGNLEDYGSTSQPQRDGDHSKTTTTTNTDSINEPEAHNNSADVPEPQSFSSPPLG